MYNILLKYNYKKKSPSGAGETTENSNSNIPSLDEF